VTQLQWRPAPPKGRGINNPWPEWGYVLRSSPAHEEGGEREFAVSTKAFRGRGGRVEALETVRVEVRDPDHLGRGRLVEIPCTEASIPADLVLLAIGFAGPETNSVVRELGLEVGPRGAITVDAEKRTSVPGVFAAGDAERGQSLIVWAIADGRRAARSVDQYLMGSTALRGSP
jgi:glutamate synthase (NADPH/NADH) small chain